MPEALKLSEVKNARWTKLPDNHKETPGAYVVTGEYNGNPDYQFLCTEKEIEELRKIQAKVAKETKNPPDETPGTEVKTPEASSGSETK